MKKKIQISKYEERYFIREESVVDGGVEGSMYYNLFKHGRYRKIFCGRCTRI